METYIKSTRAKYGEKRLRMTFKNPTNFRIFVVEGTGYFFNIFLFVLVFKSFPTMAFDKNFFGSIQKWFFMNVSVCVLSDCDFAHRRQSVCRAIVILRDVKKQRTHRNGAEMRKKKISSSRVFEVRHIKHHIFNCDPFLLMLRVVLSKFFHCHKSMHLFGKKMKRRWNFCFNLLSILLFNKWARS